MLQTKTVIPKELVAVAWDPTEILLRFSGKNFYGKENKLCRLEGKTLKISKETAEKYGIEICVE